jgi:hypothetical protein
LNIEYLFVIGNLFKIIIIIIIFTIEVYCQTPLFTLEPMAQATLVFIYEPTLASHKFTPFFPTSFTNKNGVSERVDHQTNLRLIQHHGN